MGAEMIMDEEEEMIMEEEEIVMIMEEDVMKDLVIDEDLLLILQEVLLHEDLLLQEVLLLILEENVHMIEAFLLLVRDQELLLLLTAQSALASINCGMFTFNHKINNCLF